MCASDELHPLLVVVPGFLSERDVMASSSEVPAMSRTRIGDDAYGHSDGQIRLKQLIQLHPTAI